jgi:uncharacterized protein (TIGR00369 family)
VDSKAFGGLNRRLKEKTAESRWFETTGQAPFERAKAAYWKINFLKPVWHARLQATGRVVKQGRTVGLVECDIIDSDAALVARATSTCMTLRGDQGRGR